MHAIHDHLAAGGEGVAAGGVFPHSQSDAMQYRPMSGLRKAQNRKSKYGIHVANEFLVRQVRHPAVLLANKEIGVHLRVPQGVVPSIVMPATSCPLTFSSPASSCCAAFNWKSRCACEYRARQSTNACVVACHIVSSP